ncbi:hypothetical protein Tco_0899881 [Tanacetum coccineum]
MDLYHSRLTQDDLNDLIIKYKIPRDLHPRLPSEEFMMSKLPDGSIGFTSLSWVLLDLIRSLASSIRRGFFFIDRQAILNAMVWRHPNAAIDDPRPVAGSFNMANVRRLSAHVVKLRDMPTGLLVLSGLSQVWKSHICDPVLRGADGNGTGPTFQRLHFYFTPPGVADVVILEPALKDLAIGTPSSKIVAKAEASQKRKASTSGAASSHVAKRTRSAMAQSSNSTTRPSLFVGDDDEIDDDDDDACVEIPLVAPFRSATVIPSSRNQGGSFVAPAAEGSNTRDSRGKGVMVDDVAASSAGVSRPRLSSGPAPLFRDDLAICKTIVDQFPTPGELVCVESLSDDQLTAKMGVLHCMMMSHGGELLAHYRGLNQSHYEYVLSTYSRLKGYEEKSKAKGKERKKKIKSLTKSLDNLHSDVARLSAALNQATILKAERDEQIMRLKATPPKFYSFFRGQFQCGLSMHRTKDEFAVVLKKMVNFMPGAQDRLVEVSPIVAQTDYVFLNKISKHATEPLSIILQLELEKLARPTNIPTPRDTHASPPIVKESTVTPISKSLELSVNVVPISSVVASERNEEQGGFRILDDVVKVAAVESERVFSGPTDVVVALSIDGKGDVLIPSYVADEEAVINSSKFGFVPGVLFVVSPFLLMLISSTDGLILIPTDTS